jgi:hypothetical protein
VHGFSRGGRVGIQAAILARFPGLQSDGRAGQSPDVPETMESARRWSGFVCPDCRFVFRVPRDHDGRGVVCPSCRRMLRIPLAGDRPPPLMVPIRAPQVPAGHALPTAAPEDSGHETHRRRRKSRRGGGHSWDNAAGRVRRSAKGEKRQMFWMLIGGAGLLVLLLAGVLVAMLGGSTPEPSPAPVAAADTKQGTTEADSPSAPTRGDAEFLRLAEPMARSFLDAKTVDEMLPLVRDAERAGPRMKRFYRDGTLDAPGMSAFNIDSEVIHEGIISSVRLRTRDFDERRMSFVETPDGPRIDWESWAGWSGLAWDEFLETKPRDPVLFRVVLSDVDYYNTVFRDEAKWRSYRLESPDGSHSLYGYAERDSVLDARLRPGPDVKRRDFILMLRFPADGETRDQVVIDRVVAEGWVLENEQDQ